MCVGSAVRLRAPDGGARALADGAAGIARRPIRARTSAGESRPPVAGALTPRLLRYGWQRRTVARPFISAGACRRPRPRNASGIVRERSAVPRRQHRRRRAAAARGGELCGAPPAANLPRPRTSTLLSSIATSPSAPATCPSIVRRSIAAATAARATRWQRRCGRGGSRGRRERRGARDGRARRAARRRRRRLAGRPRDRRRGGVDRHVHETLDAVAHLRRHHLHALRQLAGEHLGFVLRRHLQRAQVARVRVERHGGQRDDREEEEGDDEAKAQAHGRSRLA